MYRPYHWAIGWIGGAAIIAAQFGALPAAAGGATLYLSPSSGTFAVGSTFNVSVFVNTGGQNVNAVEADIRFPADKLQIVTPAGGPSVITVWAAQPAFSNQQGVINFKGGVPNPGINMSAGIIATITFRVTGTGQAVIQITDHSKVLLNDGAGTNILTEKRGGVYSLSLPPPEGPFVTSPTHPDPERWYKDASPIFTWEKQSDISAFSYMLNDRAVDIPDDIPDGDRTTVRYTNITDGVWYFHIKAKGVSGWGGVTHVQVRVDAQAPAGFPITIAPRARTTVRQPIVYFETTDNASGIEHYEIKLVGTGKDAVGTGLTPFFIETDSPYRTPLLELGSYDVIVRAYDHAGNIQESRIKLKIVQAFYELFGDNGILVSGRFILTWPVIWALAVILLIGLLLLLIAIARRHHRHDAMIRAGLLHTDHPVAADLKLLKEKQAEYGKR